MDPFFIVLATILCCIFGLMNLLALMAASGPDDNAINFIFGELVGIAFIFMLQWLMST